MNITTALKTLALLPILAQPVLAANGPGACSVSDLSINASACRGFSTGNDSVATVGSLITAAGWAGFTAPLTQYKDTSLLSGSTTPLFDTVGGTTDMSMGSLTFLQNIAGPFVLTLKGGKSWAGYEYTAGISAGTVITFDIPGVQGAGLSHASIYADAGGITTAVPEPETYALMLAGLAGLGFMARRRSA